MFAEWLKFPWHKAVPEMEEVQNFEDLSPQVGLEPTTLRLTAVRVVLAPAAKGC